MGEIRVYDLNGRDLRQRLGINPVGSSLFRKPEYVAVSRSGNKIFVSDWGTNTVSCLTSDGKIVYQYSYYVGLEQTHGLFVDYNGNIIICNHSRNSVQVITAAGEKHKTLLSHDDGISEPRCVTFRPSDGTLVVGCWSSDNLLEYKAP